ncbi:RDD family protein [Aureivirga marina]|uniref:RDD family protein n=1 Tax=Aureivirga marina TaxID=1182451 RepID=UPI0018CB00C7|nr:RDD family protein [Aureivirga marina]
MEKFQIQTAQNITISQNISPITKRIWAFLIDIDIMGMYAFIMLMIAKKLLGYDLTPTIISLIMLPVFFYSLLFEVLNNGKSPGKYFMKIRVVQINGEKPTVINLLVRWVLRIFDILLTTGSVASLSILLTKKGQRLGDVAAGTTVVFEKEYISLENTIITEVKEDYAPTYPQVTLLSDKDIQTIKNLYQEAKSKGNHDIIIKLNDKIINITEIETNEKPYDFINTVIQDYNYYTQM